MEIIFPGNEFAGTPGPLSILVMLLWIPVVFFFFSHYPAKKAVVISFILGWLFLPEIAIILPGIPDYDKSSATSYAVFLATLFFYSKRLTSFKPGWIDFPMAIWCVCPFISSLSNGLGAYDGVSATFEQIVVWGLPYLLGRIYLDSFLGLRQLAISIVGGGLIYAPFCLIESRMSPQLHRIFYGAHAVGDFSQSIRLSGFRPTVFLSHGLAVSAWMMVATLLSIWLWKTKTVSNLFRIPMPWVVGILLVTFLLLKSTGAYFLLLIGVSLLFVSRQLKTILPVFLLVISICVYLYISAGTENYIADQLVTNLSNFLPSERIQSLEFRFNNEELLVDHARERIMFGWAGWGRSLVATGPNYWDRLAVPDSLWINAFGKYGTIGLVSMMIAMLLPPAALLMKKAPPSRWSNRDAAPMVAIAVAIIIYMVDCLLNAMINPIYIFACGGISSIVLNKIQIGSRFRERNRGVANSIISEKYAYTLNPEKVGPAMSSQK